MRRYFKPKSVTWWAAVTPLFLGAFKATVTLHGQAEIVAVIDASTGELPAAVLINSGLFGIGLRGAV